MIDFDNRIIIAFVIVAICIFISYEMLLCLLYRQNEMFKHFYHQELKDINEKFDNEIAKLKEGKQMKYRKKPVVVEATHWTGDNYGEICNFIGKKVRVRKYTDDEKPVTLIIETLEGDHLASIDAFIIKGVHGEFYPCKPDIFKKTYEEVD